MILSPAKQQNNKELGLMVCGSAIFHLLVFFFLLNFHFSSSFKEAPVYYVDILDLPVAHPQAGSPESSGARSPAPAPAPAPAPRAEPRHEMTLPVKPSGRVLPNKPPAVPKKPADTVESSRDFEKRMNQLEQAADARHMKAALRDLQNRGRAGGPVGIPGATGNEAGSDYASYIQSRLKDAFKETIAYQSTRPEVVMRLIIGRSGRIVRASMERSSGDKLFEDSVNRAIKKAENNFPPPPGGQEFSTGFVFRPQGVGKK
jgi:colicin import membrane protein